MKLMYTPFHSETNSEYLSRINESARIFKLLMFSFVSISATYIFGTLLTANNNLKQLNTIAAVGLLINLLFNFILIPKYFALGSAIASLCAQSVTAALQLIFAYSLLKIKFRVGELFPVAVTIILLVAYGIFITEYFIPDWKIAVLSMVIFGLVVASAFKLINFVELFRILKNDKY